MRQSKFVRPGKVKSVHAPIKTETNPAMFRMGELDMNKKVTIIGPTQSGITYLDVPYIDKDRAKRLGAKWDASARKWYARNIDLYNFKKWIK